MAGAGTHVEFIMVKNRFRQVMGEVAGMSEMVTNKAREIAADFARARVRVLTGETRDSIAVTDEGVEAGGAGLFLEFGTVHMPAYPFLGPAIDDVKYEFGDLFVAGFNTLR